MNSIPVRIKYLSYFAIVFGAMTVFSGAQNLFNEEVIRTQGNIIPVVLWFNFLAGFLYILIAALILKTKRIALRLTAFLSSMNIVVLLYLLNHIYSNGAFEMRTLIAMSFRTAFWFFFFIMISRSEMYRFECKC